MDTMVHVGTQVPMVVSGITLLSYLLGFLALGAGILRISQTDDSSMLRLASWMIIGGVLLMNLSAVPAALLLSLSPAAAPDALLSSAPQSDPIETSLWVGRQLLALIGWVCMIRGLLMLTYSVPRGQATMGSAVWTLIASALLTAPTAVTSIIRATVGIM